MPDLAAREDTDPSAQAVRAETDDAIRLRGLRVHNLRNIDLDIPRDQFVVLTGPSG